MKNAAISPSMASPSTLMIRQMAVTPASKAGRSESEPTLKKASDEALAPISEKTAKNAKIYTSRHEDYFISRAALLKNIAYTRASSKQAEGATENLAADQPAAMSGPIQTPPASQARPSPLLAAQAASTAEQGIQGAQESVKSSMVEPGSGCKSCESRVYQDGSGDSGVSYQGAKGMPASLSGVYVASHEGEHATREAAKAQQEGDVITQKKVTVEMACCPDCGRMYAAGGTTTIQKMDKQDDAQSSGITVHNAVDLLDPAGEKMDMLV